MTTSLMTSARPAARPSHLVGACRPAWPARWRAAGGCQLVHAVETHRTLDELDGEPELAVCGAVVAVTSAPWTGLSGPVSGSTGTTCCPGCLAAVPAR